MINYDIQKEEVIKKYIETVSCDVCGKKYENDSDDIELQEFHHIRRTGGYGSVFGDSVTIKCDICQHCLYNIIGNYIRYEN